jgi:hypothetical protein
MFLVAALQEGRRRGLPAALGKVDGKQGVAGTRDEPGAAALCSSRYWRRRRATREGGVRLQGREQGWALGPFFFCTCVWQGKVLV